MFVYKNSRGGFYSQKPPRLSFPADKSKFVYTLDTACMQNYYSYAYALAE